MKVGSTIYLIAAFTGLVFFSCENAGTNKKTPPFDVTTGKGDRFFSQDGQFRIHFDEPPVAYARDVPYESGKVRLFSFVYEKGVNLIYAISYTDYPAGFTGKTPAKDFLYGLLKSYEETMQAATDNQRNITVNNAPGLYYQVSNGDTFVYGEYILKGNRLFQLTVTKEGSYADEEDAKAFFNSLELL